MSKDFTIVDQVAAKYDADIVIYAGTVERPEDRFLIEQCRSRRLRKNIILLLETRGGDANAAYRIARAFQAAYRTLPEKETSPGQPQQQKGKRGEFIVYVNGVCKSAGTIICLGANKILMSEAAELGPIDAQLLKQDEVGERTSGLTPIQALQFLETQSVLIFKRHFKALRNPEDLGFSTKMAADLATKLTVGLLGPIYQQIDPIRLAEVDRSLKIAKEYGERLRHNNNLKTGAIDQLLARYPSHGFVIDRKEAQEIFSKVETPPADLEAVKDLFENIMRLTASKDEDTFEYFVSSEPPVTAYADNEDPATEPHSDEDDDEVIDSEGAGSDNTGAGNDPAPTEPQNG